MNKSIKVDKKSGTVTLKVELSKRRVATDTIVNFLTRDAKLLLLKEGYTVVGCRKKDSITNHRDVDSHKGEWVFDVKQDSKSPEKKKESLTKKVDPAIIEVKKPPTSQRKGK
jgi:hypothetical protein